MRSYAPLLLAITVIGCSNDKSAQARPDAKAPLEKITLTGVVAPYSPAGTAPGAVLEGVRVCKLDTQICTVTDTAGAYALDVEADPAGSLLLSKEGYVSLLWPGATGPEDTVGLSSTLPSEAIIQGFAALLSTPYPVVNTGLISAQVFGSVADPDSGILFNAGLAGVTARVVSGKAKGPAYFSEGGVPDPSLTSTTRGGARVGFYEAEPGDLTLAFDGLGAASCSVQFGFPGGAPGTLRVLVRAQTVTAVIMQCE